MKSGLLEFIKYALIDSTEIHVKLETGKLQEIEVLL